MDLINVLKMEKCEELESSGMLLKKCGEIFYDTLAAPDINLNFQCTFCQKMFAELDEFLLHLQSDHSPTPEECPFESDKEEKSEEILFAVEERVSQYVLDKDENSTSSECLVKVEISNGHELEMDDDDDDDEDDDHNSNELSPEEKKRTDSHSKASVANRRRREYICPRCCKVFKKTWDLKEHMHIHDGLKPYKCEHCPASFACKSNLRVHIRGHSGEKSFVCHFCTRSFTSTTSRYRHERSHTGERPYVCEFCGKSFSTSSGLRSHRSSQHLKERNFVCDICDRRFNRPSQLRMHHTNIHTEVPRTHICMICEAAFKGIIALKTHLKIHREKTYECSECGKKFAQRGGLYAHRRTHKKQRDTFLTDIYKKEV
uniref:C2H2-type domain-containing protein n=1 Tax=Glossina brevipalpis TaxID=37001 RepID=A0A1A9WZF5_9MUSC